MEATPAQHRHTPVMLDRCVELLSPALAQPGAVCIDGTLGMGGHTEAILAACPQARVVGIDRDAQAIELASARLARFGERFVAHRATYDDIAGALAAAGATTADAILLDLGVSSLQIDEADRGFSYGADAPLDMRMDQAEDTTAADLLRDLDADALAHIFRTYGEERFAGRIARAIVERREAAPLERSADLVAVVTAAIPAAARHGAGNPAKRVFQALRIAVNRELEVLEATLPAAVAALAVGGRIAVMAYHSLEDRMVKHVFAEGAEVQAPAGLPVVPPEAQPYLKLLTRGADKAGPAELDSNPRSKPARLRAATRLAPTPPGRGWRAAA